MAYAPGFEHDVFVSSAWADNVEQLWGKRWVSDLVQDLRQGVAQHLGAAPSFFLDERPVVPLDGPDEYALVTARKSAVFLAVLSPSYLTCKQSKAELRAFAQGENAAQRIFVAELIPTESDSRPAALRHRKAFRFYQIDRGIDLPTRLQSQAYADAVERLVAELAQSLRVIRAAGPARAPDSSPDRESAASTFDVFISYPHQDKPTADAACATLEAAGIRCWIASRDIVPGRNWGESIVDAIASAKIMVLIFSRHANASPQIMREVERAVNKSMPIITVRTEDAPMSKSLQYFLSTPHWLDALTPPLEAHLKRLVAASKDLLRSGLLDRT